MKNIRVKILSLFEKYPDRYVNSVELSKVAPDSMSTSMGSDLSRLYGGGFVERIEKNGRYWYKPTKKGILSITDIQSVHDGKGNAVMRKIRSLQSLDKLNTWSKLLDVQKLVIKHYGISTDNGVFLRLLQHGYVIRQKSDTGNWYVYLLSKKGKQFLESDYVVKCDAMTFGDPEELNINENDCNKTADECFLSTGVDPWTCAHYPCDKLHEFFDTPETSETLTPENGTPKWICINHSILDYLSHIKTEWNSSKQIYKKLTTVRSRPVINSGISWLKVNNFLSTKKLNNTTHYRINEKGMAKLQEYNSEYNALYRNCSETSNDIPGDPVDNNAEKDDENIQADSDTTSKTNYIELVKETIEELSKEGVDVAEAGKICYDALQAKYKHIFENKLDNALEQLEADNNPVSEYIKELEAKLLDAKENDANRIKSDLMQSAKQESIIKSEKTR